MIYTIEHTESCEARFRAGEDVMCPAGKTVFMTRAQAERAASHRPGHGVYGVLADWQSQVKPARDLSHGSLTTAADLIQLEEGE
jgi:hypothetical protein